MQSFHPFDDPDSIDGSGETTVSPDEQLPDTSDVDADSRDGPVLDRTGQHRGFDPELQPESGAPNLHSDGYGSDGGSPAAPVAAEARVNDDRPMEHRIAPSPAMQESPATREPNAASVARPEQSAMSHPVATYHQNQVVHHQQQAREFFERAQVHDQIARDHAAMVDIYRNNAPGRS